ncbi:hypothetical protein EBR96_02555, partial [bacterium]|nr:hypothetical protein [bacterium]
YAALVFPYTLTAVSIGIGAISVAGNDWLDHRFRNPEPAVLNPGTECPRIEIAAQTKDADLLGISRIDLTTPQTQFSKTHPKISALQATSGGIILGENVHEWPDPLRAQIYKMVTEQNAWLGKKFKIPFNVAFLGITGNDTGTRLQNEAHSHGAVYAKISPLLHYPADKPQIQKQLRQYMLIYARQKMQLFWDFRALNWLIDRFILKDKQKIYFGMRYINRLIENAEIRANIRLSAERSSDITQATEDKTLRRDGVNLEDLDAAWQDFIMETPALRIFKGNKQD